MKSKTTLIVGCCVLLSCVVLGYLVMKSPDAPSEVLTEQKPPQSRPSNFSGSDSALGAGNTRASRSTPRESASSSYLIERFGEARTGLSKKVTTDLAGLFEDSLNIGEMAAKMGGAEDMAGAATAQTVNMLARQLELTDEQRELAAPIVAAEVQRRFDAVRDLASQMKSSPEPMMGLFLYGDALARGTITREEYDTATAETRTSLESASANILGRRPQAPIPLGSDGAFLGELSTILTPEQQGEFAEMTAAPADPPASRRGPGNIPFQDGVPVMELERLDQTVTSARVLTSGMQQVFQGLDGLQQNLGD